MSRFQAYFVVRVALSLTYKFDVASLPFIQEPPMFEGLSPHWQLYAIVPDLEPVEDDQNVPSHSASLLPGLTTLGESQVAVALWRLADESESVSLQSEICPRHA
jgi:hypothetical protein